MAETLGMNQPGAIAIPEDLLPSDGRFGSGPAKILPAAVADLASQAGGYLGTSHRRPTVKDVVHRVRRGLEEMYALPAGYEVVLGLGGATAFWDVATACLIEHRSGHFTCGEFSGKFADAVRAAPHLDEPTVVTAKPGSAPEPRPVPDVDTIAFIHNETSTGVQAPFDRLGDELVLVDATSAAGVIPIDVAATDAYYFSPQKALGSEGGLWVSLVSPKAVERAAEIDTRDRWIPPFLSLSIALDNSRKDQTYNTPALATLWFLAWQIEHVLENGGLPWAHRRSTASSDVLYRWAEQSAYANPFVAASRLRSATVVTIDLDDAVSADGVSHHLRANGIVDTESYRKLGRNQLRIATFPNIDTEDVESLTGCIDFIVQAM